MIAAMIEREVIRFIKEEKLFSSTDPVLVALSGGADSVALLRILHSAGYRCEAAHCNFHLRGEESDRDETFVRQLCQSLDIPLHTIDFNTTTYAAERHISIEMAARELRYDWFEKLRKEQEAAVITVAHHRDDSVETMLLKLLRGTGIAGLQGIRPRNGAIVRPLLCVDREEILHYLQSIGQTYVTDSSNLEDTYTRNKIRLRLLPLLQEINPSVKSTLLETGQHLKEVADIYNRYIEEARQRIATPQGICIDALLKETSPQTILFEILHPLGFTTTQIDNILRSLDGQAGKQFVCKEWRVIKDRDILLIEKRVMQEEDALPPFQLLREEHAYGPDFHIPKEKHIACFDADKLSGEIHCRQWQAGDLFVPFGMKGKKLVSDYLTDRKFSLLEKERQWVLCCNEQIVWIIGERTDNRFRVDATTKRVILYTLITPVEKK
jgi:tRNA(Ile)-lysidine synthase